MRDTPDTYDHDGPRSVKTALLNGWRQRCPCCGTGPVFADYLTVRDHCAVCETELRHHRTDDGPAWATILITGHLMAPLMLTVYTALRPPGWVMAASFGTAFTLLALYLLPRIKGSFVAFQWAKRLHGFGGDDTTGEPSTAP